jgi:hypothetical protein
MRTLILILVVLLHVSARAATGDILLTTLNCYWFLGEEESRNADKPPTKDQY